MIIFDLDGTLANIDHRRHFVDPRLNPDYVQLLHAEGRLAKLFFYHKETKEKFIPDWKAFNEACDKDEPNEHVMDIFFRTLSDQQDDVEVWSGRSESVEDKTIKWMKHLLDDNFGTNPYTQWSYNLRLRPNGDFTPDDELKEKWLDESIAKGETIKYVFDDRPKVIRMWRRRGIFVFNCCQHDREF